MNSVAIITKESDMKAMLGIVLGAIFGFAGIVSVHAQGTPVSKMDIAGVQIGMTEAEVEAALKTFDSGLELASVMAVFNYSDGVSHTLESPEFLDRVEAKQGNQGVSITVYFSGGPGEDVRVIGVSRSALIRPTLPRRRSSCKASSPNTVSPLIAARINPSRSGKKPASRLASGADYKNEVDINIGKVSAQDSWSMQTRSNSCPSGLAVYREGCSLPIHPVRCISGLLLPG